MSKEKKTTQKLIEIEGSLYPTEKLTDYEIAMLRKIISEHGRTYIVSPNN